MSRKATGLIFLSRAVRPGRQHSGKVPRLGVRRFAPYYLVSSLGEGSFTPYCLVYETVSELGNSANYHHSEVLESL